MKKDKCNENIMSYDYVANLNEAYKTGLDLVNLEELEQLTIPGLIEHETANLSKLFKPFITLKENGSPTTQNYYSDMYSMGNKLVNATHFCGIEHAMYNILHEYYQDIHIKLNEIFTKYGINYDRNFVIDQIDANINTNISIINSTFNIKALNNIEQMLQIYTIKECYGDKNPMEYSKLLFELISPYIHTAVTSILYNMYNHAVYILHRYTLYDTLVNSNKYNLGELEQELFETYVDIHDKFKRSLHIYASNWVFTKTAQDEVPEMGYLTETLNK